MFKYSNPVRDYNDPCAYAIFKCSESGTASGYHYLTIFQGNIEEISPVRIRSQVGKLQAMKKKLPGNK